MNRLAIRLLLCTLATGPLPVAMACGYDAIYPNPFEQRWPGSLDVAMATAAAISDRNLDPVPKITGPDGFSRSYQWLNQLKGSLKGGQLPGNVSILLVDSGLWSRVRGKESLLLQTHTEGPVRQDRIMLTSEAGINALLSGQLSAAQATELGLLVIQDDPDDAFLKHLNNALALHNS
ncbi:hypothetical protein [Aeromonas media]|uniref:hypothetical protein n=1 Tax=Aeromonas media TaxID=651 RepID=UPI0038D0272F